MSFVACAGALNPRALPLGAGWSCFTAFGNYSLASSPDVLHRAHSYCDRSQPECDRFRAEQAASGGEGLNVPCATQQRAACYTYRDLRHNADLSACFASFEDCRFWRQANVEDHAGDLSAVSACDWVAEVKPGAGPDAAQPAEDSPLYFCSQLVALGSPFTMCDRTAEQCSMRAERARTQRLQVARECTAATGVYCFPDSEGEDGAVCAENQADCEQAHNARKTATGPCAKR